MLTDAQGLSLCRLARAAITEALGGSAAVLPKGDVFLAPGACFVTLHRNGMLHGCIGSLVAHRPLAEDVVDNAVSAAFRDPRATELRPSDEQNLTVEVSVLSPMERIAALNKEEALAQLVPGEHGVVLQHGNKRGTFLPQVWKDLPDKSVFWRELLRKAGLPPGFDSPDLQVFRYTVKKWREEPPCP
jgi:AmmeMemoRadiSam system protein A